MRIGLWDNLSIYAIAFGALLLLIKVAQRRTSQALSEFIGMVLIIVMAFIFYAYPIQMMGGIDLVTTGVSDAVMEGPYKATVGGTAEDAKGKATGLCWNLFVHKPWQVLEFGSVKTAKKYEGSLLKLKPESEARMEMVKKLAESQGCFSKNASYQGERLATAMVFLLFNLMLMGVMIIFAVLIMGFQFLTLLYLMLGIFVLLVSLLPAFGIFLIRKWGMRIVGISFIRVLVVFFLSVTMVLMDVIYGFTDEYGLFVTMDFILIIIGAIWFERYRLLELFAGFQSNGNLKQSMNKSLEVDYNAIQNFQNLRKNASRNWQNINAETSGSPGSKVQSGQHSSYDKQEVRGNRGNNKNYNQHIEQTSEKMQQAAENLRTASQDIGTYSKNAEAVLQKHYELSKSKSEQEAQVKNEPVEYDSFVKRTDKVRAKGQGNFEQGDITHVANKIRSTVEQGGHAEEVVSDGRSIYRTNRQDINRPKSLSAVQMDYTEYADTQESGRQKKLKGIKFFQDNFGEEQGEELFETLKEKYGEEKMVNYRPFYNNNGKQSYAQVVKQLNENIQVGKASSKQNSDPGRTAKKSPEIEPVKVRGGKHGNE